VVATERVESRQAHFTEDVNGRVFACQVLWQSAEPIRERGYTAYKFGIHLLLAVLAVFAGVIAINRPVPPGFVEAMRRCKW
jgi:hypothetical protein